MHWDGSISMGNVLTFAGMLIALIVAFNKFVSGHKESSITLTNAVNNLSTITKSLQDAIEKQNTKIDSQNTRLSMVEKTIAVNDEVDRRMMMLGYVKKKQTDAA